MNQSEPTPPEKRGNAREPLRRPARLRVPAQELEGLTRDVSIEGAYVLAGDGLRMELLVGDPGQEKAVPVRVVRVETMPGGGLGIAVEFLA